MSANKTLAMRLRSHGQAHVGFYLEHHDALTKLASELNAPHFSKPTKDELTELLGDVDSSLIVEGYARFKQYGDLALHAESRKAVSKFLKRDGITLPRGKRTSPGLEMLVEDLLPILHFLGLPLASSEKSKIIEALRIVAAAQEVPGDPRDEVRRLISEDNRVRESSRDAVRGIISNAANKYFRKQS